jgi:hypothetical protein
LPSLTSTFLSTDQLSTVFPTFEEIGVLSGILTGLLYTGFFSVCPFIFKAFANFGSGATSERQAEFRAIRYYWIFMVVTAFTGSSLATMLTSAFYNGTLLAYAVSATTSRYGAHLAFLHRLDTGRVGSRGVKTSC